MKEEILTLKLLHKEHYDTYEEAFKVLNERRDEALLRINERGDKVITDRSFVFNWNVMAGGSGYEPRLILWTEFMNNDTLEFIKNHD